MGEPTSYTYPKVEDYRQLVLKAGRGCFMWKRDPLGSSSSCQLTQWTTTRSGWSGVGSSSSLSAQTFRSELSTCNRRSVLDIASFGLETDKEKVYNVVNYLDSLSESF